MGIEYIDKQHAKLVVTKGSGSSRERKVKRITYLNKKDAKRQYDDFERAVSYNVDSKLTVEQLLDWYIQLFDANGGKRTTVVGYKTSEKRINHLLGRRRCCEVLLYDIAHFVSGEAKIYKPKTIKNDLSLLNSAYKEAIRHGFLESNPCEYAKAPKQSKPRIEVLSDTSIELFLHQLEDAPLDFKVMCELALFCGLRRSEILGLLKEDVSSTVTINKVRHRLNGRDIVASPKTSSSIRTLAVPRFIQSDVSRLIYEQQERAVESEYLILNGFGEPVSPHWVTKNMKLVTEDANLPNVTFHGLRHTCASMMIAKGVPVSEVSAQLGHSSIDITLRTYTHLFTDASTASKRIAGIMEGLVAPNGHQNK